MLRRLTKYWRAQAVHTSLIMAGCLFGYNMTLLHPGWGGITVGALLLTGAAAWATRQLPRLNYGYAVAASSGAAGGATAVMMMGSGNETMAVTAVVAIPMMSAGMIVEYHRREARR